MASLKDQLSKINLRKAKLTTGETVEQMMARIAQELYDNIQYYIDKWYNEYHPKMYSRVGNYRKALYAEDIVDIRVENGMLVIGLGFDESLSWQTSLFEFQYTDDYGNRSILMSRDVHQSYVPILMEEGWHSQRLEAHFHKRIKNFTYFEGIHAVTKGISDLYRKYPYMWLKINRTKFYLHSYRNW